MLERKQGKWNNPSRSERELEGSNGSLGEFEERLRKAINDTLALLGPIGRHKFSLRLKDEFNLELTRLASDLKDYRQCWIRHLDPPDKSSDVQLHEKLQQHIRSTFAKIMAEHTLTISGT